MTTYKLVGMPLSPWTLKARWALDVCGFDYVFEEYVPPFHALLLRLRTGRLRGPISVPVLLGADGPIWGALQIATFADRLAAGRTGTRRLGEHASIAPWSALSEAAMCEGRVRVTRAYLEDPAAQDELMPPIIPRCLQSSMRWLVRDAMRRIERKYSHLVTAGALTKALDATRSQLTRCGGAYLLGQFSYADIAMAAVLEGVEPLGAERVPRGVHSRAVWTVPELAAEYRDLLRWREDLLAWTNPASLRPRP